ncbi:MAG: OprO/OprP family phosphate-selective porin [Gemmataceae bacterium]
MAKILSIPWSFINTTIAIFVSCSLVYAQDSTQDIKTKEFIQAQQAKMDQLSKLLEEQKVLIQEQSKLLEGNKGISKASEVPLSLPYGVDFSLKNTSKINLDTDSQSQKALAPRGLRNTSLEDGMLDYWGKDGFFNLRSEDDTFVTRFGGLFQFDIGFYSVDPYVQNLLGPPTLQQGSDFRRARIHADGIAHNIVEWMFEMDFSKAADLNKNRLTSTEPDVSFQNMYVGLRGLPWIGTVRIGHIKEELSFYSASSGKNLPFMERPNSWDAFENPYLYDNGITISRTYLDDRLYSWMGLFQTNTRTDALGVNGTGELAFDVRLCAFPIYDEPSNHWLNVGATGSVRGNPNELDTSLPVGQATVQPQVRAGSSNQVPNLINTGAIYTTAGTQLYTLCLNYANGPFSLGAQYDAQMFNNSYMGGLPGSPANPNAPRNVKPLGNLYFDGFSVEALCFLTHGDHRGVNKMAPSFLQVIPVENLSFGSGGGLRGKGAWEVGLKYDFVRSQFQVPDSPNQVGGYLGSTTLGINWYLNPSALIMANYVYTTGFFGQNGPDNAAFHSFGSRFQFTF